MMSYTRTVMVNVTDVPDQPPQWFKPCTFDRFDEEMPGRSTNIFTITYP